MAIDRTTEIPLAPQKADPEMLALQRQLVAGQTAGFVMNDQMLWHDYFNGAWRSGRATTIAAAAEQADVMLAEFRTKYPLVPAAAQGDA